MGNKNRRNMIAEAAQKLSPGPVAPTLTEVDPNVGLTPEQLAVAQELKPTGQEIEMTKERHPDRLKKSTIQSPVKLVKSIADQMMIENPSTSRKDILAKCLEAGIALYTARTQYQIWKKSKQAVQLEQAKAV